MLLSSPTVKKSLEFCSILGTKSHNWLFQNRKHPKKVPRASAHKLGFHNNRLLTQHPSLRYNNAENSIRIHHISSRVRRSSTTTEPYTEVIDKLAGTYRTLYLTYHYGQAPKPSTFLHDERYCNAASNSAKAACFEPSTGCNAPSHT